MKPYIQEFIEAICPDYPDLYLSMFTEKKCLEDATFIINNLREELRIYKEAYDTQLTLKEGKSAANDELRAELSIVREERNNYRERVRALRDKVDDMNCYLGALENVQEWAEKLEQSIRKCDRDGNPQIDIWALTQLRKALHDSNR